MVAQKPLFLEETSTGRKFVLLASRLGFQDQQWIKVSDLNPDFKLPKPKKSSLLSPPALPNKYPFFDDFTTDKNPLITSPPPGVGKVMKVAWLGAIVIDSAIKLANHWGYDIKNKKESL